MKKIIVLLLLTGISWAKDARSCYSYDVSKIEATYASLETDSTFLVALKTLIVVTVKPSEILFLAATDQNGTIYRQYYFLCQKRGKSIECGVDCDGGHFVFDRTMRLTYLGMRYEDSRDNTLSLFMKKGVKSLVPVKVKCPLNIDNRRYVCYEEKEENGNYQECYLSTSSCKSVNSKHFGKYPNDHSAYSALLRCKHSEPRK
jgi:hypothetical protein